MRGTRLGARFGLQRIPYCRIKTYKDCPKLSETIAKFRILPTPAPRISHKLKDQFKTNSVSSDLWKLVYQMQRYEGLKRCNNICLKTFENIYLPIHECTFPPRAYSFVLHPPSPQMNSRTL